MRQKLPFFLFFLFLSLMVPTVTFAACVENGATGCIRGTFNSCCDPKAACEEDKSGRGGGFTCILIISPTPAPDRDVCQGYDSNDPDHKGETGICYYSADDKLLPNGQLPSCSSLTAADYHQDKNYHHISEEIKGCNWNRGNTYQCCAPDKQPSPIAPPPPCITGQDGYCNQVDTGLGEINVQPGAIVGSILSILLGISGGIAVLLIAFSGYRIMFSNADEERMKGAREMLTSAIIGLLFIIFSTVVLRIIGVDILHLPGIQ